MENITLSVSDWGKVKNLKTGIYEEVKKFTWSNNKNCVKIEVYLFLLRLFIYGIVSFIINQAIISL